MSELEIIIAKKGVSMSDVGVLPKPRIISRRWERSEVWSACCSGEISLDSGTRELLDLT